MIQTFRLAKSKNAKQHHPGEYNALKPKKTRGYERACKLRSSQRWQNLRKMVLKRHPLCMFCGKLAKHLHHIEMAVDNEQLFFSTENLAPLCEKDHERIHAAYKRGFKADILFPKHKRIKLDE